MEILKKLFTTSPEKAATALPQPANEAIVDLLLLATYADNHLSLSEKAQMERKLANLEWQSGTAIDFYVAGATARIRDALADADGERKLLQFINERLHSEDAKYTAITLLDHLLRSDGFVQKEDAFLDRVKGALRAVHRRRIPSIFKNACGL